MARSLFGLLVIFLSCSCSLSGSDMRASMGPCATASRDIAILEAERSSVTKQSNAGARAVFPISQAAQLLSSDYNDQVAADISDYSQALNLKIAQIRSECAQK